MDFCHCEERSKPAPAKAGEAISTQNLKLATIEYLLID